MMRAVVIVCLMVLVVIVPAAADVTITMEHTTKDSEGERTVEVVHYYRPTKMRHEYGDSVASIIDLDEACSITLMPAAKNYVKQTFDAQRQMAAAVKLPEQTLTIEETDEQETISGYECRKLIVKVVQADLEAVNEFWVAEDVEGLDDVKAFGEGMVEAFKDSPAHARNHEIGQKLAEKGYFPIRTVLRHPGPDGVEMTMTVTKIEEGDLDDELFEVPEDYKPINSGGGS